MKSTREAFHRFLLVAATLLPMGAFAQDELVSAAIRAALLERPEVVRSLAEAQRRSERTGPRDGAQPDIAENIAVLGIATATPAPSLAEKRKALSGFRRDQVTRAIDRLIRRHEPRQRYLEAASDRRYEERRSVVNAVTAPLAGLAQGQFFPLFSLPFDAARWTFVGRVHATPEERRELRTARDVGMRLPEEPVAIRAEQRIESLTKKRRQVTILEARSNGKRAAEEGRVSAALFWFGQEMRLRDVTVPASHAHQKLLEFEVRKANRRRESLTVVDGERLLGSSTEVAVYTRLVRSSLTDNWSEVLSSARELRVGWPSSAALGAAAATEAVASRVQQDAALTRVLLLELANSGFTPWNNRAADLLARPDFDPRPALLEAMETGDKRRRRYVLEGRDPQIVDRSLRAEEARLARGSVIDRARVFFISDTVARLIFLPLADPVPRPELLDLMPNIDAEWFNDPQNQRWLRSWSRALRNERRHEDAARVWDRQGDAVRAVKARERAARHLERLADRSSSQRLRLAIYTRISNGYPVYTRRDRVLDKLADAERLAVAKVVITPKELQRWTILTGESGLALEPTLLDGRRSNGEIGRDGLLLMPAGLVAWKDRETNRWIERFVGEDRIENTARLLEPRRRMDAVRTENARPLPRKRVPLALEAGVYPGFEVFPGLVPLEPDGKERSLYE